MLELITILASVGCLILVTLMLRSITKLWQLLFDLEEEKMNYTFKFITHISVLEERIKKLEKDHGKE